MSSLRNPLWPVTVTFIIFWGSGHYCNCNPWLMPQDNLWTVTLLLPMVFWRFQKNFGWTWSSENVQRDAKKGMGRKISETLMTDSSPSPPPHAVRGPSPSPEAEKWCKLVREIRGFKKEYQWVWEAHHVMTFSVPCPSQHLLLTFAKLWVVLRFRRGRPNHDHDYFRVHLAGPHFSILACPWMLHQMSLLDARRQRKHKDSTFDVPSIGCTRGGSYSARRRVCLLSTF